jgi:hypothetical protein
MKPEPKLHSGHMEIAVATLINWAAITIVPNVYWGLGLRHEADLISVDSKLRFTEIEIKISKSDLRADFKKGHNHSHPLITRLFYAVPEKLVPLAIELVPKKCGIISVAWNPGRGCYLAKYVRRAIHRPSTVSETERQQKYVKLMELGVMRIWTLKKVILNK